MIKVISNDEEYMDVLRKIYKGALIIESVDFQKWPKEKQELARREYDRLEHMVLVYKGLI